MINIVGAGLTGATLARLYAGSGERVTVWEKAKGVDLWVSTQVAVGHEKTMVARGG